MVHQLVEVHLVADGPTERSQNSGRIISTTVESSVNQTLDALAQRLEQRGNRERRPDDGQVGGLAGNGADKLLEKDNTEEVDRDERCGERAVDQRAPNDQVDVVQAIPQ